MSTLGKRWKIKDTSNMKGRVPYMKGKKHTEETKQKIREKRTLQDMSYHTGDKCSSKRPEVKEKIRQTLIRKKITGPKHAYFKKGQTPWNKNLHFTNHHTETSKKKISIASKKCWQNKEYAMKILSIKSPNKTEKYLNEILNEILPNKYKFVGDGKKRIGSKFPDFIWKHKIIELYGDYWHRNDHLEDKINYYECFGYDCLVIWERDLRQSLELTKIRIIEYTTQF